jgi:hypothetical protein
LFYTGLKIIICCHAFNCDPISVLARFLLLGEEKQEVDQVSNEEE